MQEAENWEGLADLEEGRVAEGGVAEWVAMVVERAAEETEKEERVAMVGTVEGVEEKA